MRHYNDENLLEMVEKYAQEVGAIASEEELSAQFDDMIAECFPGFDWDDKPLVSETFNNWTDGLCREGEIHPEQYSQYVYTGKYS